MDKTSCDKTLGHPSALTPMIPSLRALPLGDGPSVARFSSPTGPHKHPSGDRWRQTLLMLTLLNPTTKNRLC